MPASPDYVEGLIHKKLFLLAMAFEQIDDSTLSAFKYEITNTTGILLNTPSQIYKLTQVEIETLQKFQEDNSEKITRYLDGHLRRELKLKRLLDERAELNRAINRRLALGSVLLVITFVYIFAITFLQIPAENARFADAFGGIMVGAVMTEVLAFLFGNDNVGKINKIKTEVDQAHAVHQQNFEHHLNQGQDDNDNTPKLT